MSDRAIKFNHASAEKARHPLHNYQSLYKSCLSGGSANTALQEHQQLSSCLGHYTKNHLIVSGAGNASFISGPPKGYRKVESGSASSIMWSRNISNDEAGMVGYSISDISQQSGRGFVFKNDEETNDVQEVKSLLAQNFEESNNALCISKKDFSSINPVSTLLSKTSRRKASHVNPQGFTLGECIDEEGRSSMSSLVYGEKKVDYLPSMQSLTKNLRDGELTILEQGESNHQSNSTVFHGKEKLDICSTSTKSVMPVSRKNDGSILLLNIPRPAFGPAEEIDFYGVQSSRIDEDMISLKSPNTDAFASAGKGIQRKRVIPNIPDLNIALSDLPDAEDGMGNLDPTTTSTKCLETTSLHAVQPSSTSRRIKRCKMSASDSISFGTKSLNLEDSYPDEIGNRSSRKFREGGLNKSELTSAGEEVIVLDSDDGPASVKTGSISFKTKNLNWGDSYPHEIVNRSSRKFGESGLNKSELTFAGKEVIVLDSDDDDDGTASVKISGSSSKEFIEMKNIASDKNGKSPSAQGMEKTEEITRMWPLYPPTVRRTAQETPEPTVVLNPQTPYVALESIREREVSRTVPMDVLTGVSNKQQIKIQDKVWNN